MKDYKKILVFDNDCLLCNSAVKFIFANAKKSEFYFTHFNSNYFQNVLYKKYNFKNVDSIILINNGNVLYKSEAVFTIAQTLRFPLKFFSYFRYFPKFITDAVYDFIAKNRYSIFGKTNSCTFNPELSKRLLR